MAISLSVASSADISFKNCGYSFFKFLINSNLCFCGILSVVISLANIFNSKLCVLICSICVSNSSLPPNIEFIIDVIPSVTLLTVGNSASPILALNLSTESIILEYEPSNVSDNLDVAPAIPAVGSSIISVNAFLNSGNVNFVISSIPLKSFNKFNIPLSLNTSAAPAPPANALPIALAASTTSVPINAAKSATPFIFASASKPNAFNCAPASTTDLTANGVVAATLAKFWNAFVPAFTEPYIDISRTFKVSN